MTLIYIALLLILILFLISFCIDCCQYTHIPLDWNFFLFNSPGKIREFHSPPEHVLPSYNEIFMNACNQQQKPFDIPSISYEIIMHTSHIKGRSFANLYKNNRNLSNQKKSFICLKSVIKEAQVLPISVKVILYSCNQLPEEKNTRFQKSVIRVSIFH